MNSTLRAMWLNNLEQIARGTLTRIDRKIEQSGGIVNEDQDKLDTVNQLLNQKEFIQD